MNSSDFIRCVRPLAGMKLLTIGTGQPFTFSIMDSGLQFSPQGSPTNSVLLSQIDDVLARFTNSRSTSSQTYSDLVDKPEYVMTLVTHLWRASIDEAGHVIKAQDLKIKVKLATIDPARINTSVAPGGGAVLFGGSTEVEAGGTSLLSTLHYTLAGMVAMKSLGLGGEDEKQSDYKIAVTSILPLFLAKNQSQEVALTNTQELIKLNLGQVMEWMSSDQHTTAVKRCAAFLFDSLTIEGDNVEGRLAEFYA